MSASAHRIYFLLQLAAAKLKKEADRSSLESAGISTAQAAVLLVVQQHGPVTQRQIANALSQQESAVTTMVSRLLNAELVTRARSPADGRAWEIETTEKGKQVLADAQDILASVNAHIDQVLTEQEVERLAQALTAIIKPWAADEHTDGIAPKVPDARDASV